MPKSVRGIDLYKITIKKIIINKEIKKKNYFDNDLVQWAALRTKYSLTRLPPHSQSGLVFP